MTTLRFRLSEHFGVDDDVCEWARVDARGALLEEGRGAPRDWPAADHHLGVVCAARARLIRLELPDLPPAKLKAALLYAVETRIAGDAEAQQLVAGPRGNDGKRGVIVVERHWLERALQLLADAGISRPRLVAESELPQVATGSWWWNADATHGFVLTADDSFALEPASDAATPPIPLQLAVERAGVARPGRLVIAGASLDRDAFASWQAALGVEIEALPRWHWARLPAVRYESACALNAAPTSPGRETGGALPGLRLAGILLASALVIHTGLTLLDWARLSWQESRLLAEAAALHRDVFGVEAKGSASLSAFRAAYATARHAAGQTAPGDALPLLAQAGSALATLPPSSLRQARFAEGRWTLDLAPLDATSRDRLLASLAASGLTVMYAEQAGGLRLAIQESQP